MANNINYEEKFIEEYDKLAPDRVLRAFFTGWILYISFGFLDIFMAPDSLYLFLFIRFLIITPAIWILYIISKLEIIRKNIQKFLFISSVSAGGGILAMIFLSNSSEPSFYFYYAGLFLIILWTYALCPIRFIYAAAANWTIIIIYNIIAIFTQELIYNSLNTLPFKIFLNNNFFLISATIIGMTAGKTIENYRKRDFIQRQELQKIQSELYIKAHYDDLTSLPNRSMFFNQAKTFINLNKRDNKMSFILYLDLDGFKTINDNLGHAKGDTVLKETSEIIQNSIRETDVPCRFGGDEFLILLTHCSEKKDAEIVSQRIIESFQQKPPFCNGKATIPFPTISIGIAKADFKQDINNIICKSDSALYKAKSSGKNKYCFF